MRRILLALLVAASLLATPGTAQAAWVQVYRQDFSGSVLPANVIPYKGGTFHPDESITVHGGVMDFWLYDRRNPVTPTGWESARSAIVPAVNGRYLNLRYGQFQWSMLVQPDSGGLVGWNVVGLLWPESNDGAAGEVDFPEWHMGGSVMTYVHQATGQPGCPTVQSIHQIVPGPGPLGVWHTYGIRWSPSGFSFWIDGLRYWGTACGQPRTAMHLVIQVGADPGRAGVAPATSHGHVQIGFIQIDRYQ